MVSQGSAIRLEKRERAAAAQWSVATRMRAVLAIAIAAAFALALKAASANATTYTVNTLQDTSGNSDCSLRDAINAANGTPTSGSTCTTAGSGNDTIQFNVTGTITLGSALPQITDSNLTINGPASQGITINGNRSVWVMQVASGAMLKLNKLTIVNVISFDGGIDNEGTLTVTNSTISISGAGLGGIANGGTLTVSNSTFSGNYSPSGGGAILNGGTLIVTNSTFSGNIGNPGGGIANGGTLTVTNSTFSGNGADFAAGGIDNSGRLTITNSTFSGNRGIMVSGIGNHGTLTVTNSIFSGNIAFDGGSSIYNYNDLGAKTSVKNTILAGSIDFSGAPISNCGGSITDIGYNISDDDSCGFSATGSLNSINPGLSSDGLTNNGGPTQTIALAPGSPAIDAIPFADCTDQASPPNRINTDQRGALRPDAGELLCDIGAYEVQDFAGQPNCHGESVSALAHQFGNINAAASALGFASVQALQNAITISCGG